MSDALHWIAAGGTIAAAALIAANRGRKWTGAGFVFFALVSMVWIYNGATGDGAPILVQNGILLAINLYGVWQYLISRKHVKVIERVDKVAERIDEQVEAEMQQERSA